MTFRLFSLLLTLLSVSFNSLTASPKKGFEIQHIAPPSWWTGMNNPNLQIMIHAENVAAAEISIESDLAELRVVNKVENPNYVFLDVVIAKQGKGTFDINFKFKNKKFSHTYKLHDRIFASDKIQGLDPSDLIYLIMPDRFANGNPNNDIIPTMQETAINRDSIYWRHGGDLHGISNHLQYLQDLGVTALWLNPVQTNDQPQWSYHGYAVTDHYEIDPRLGTNQDYLKLVNQCHDRGMKVVMDIIHNHVGDQHWFIKDLPMKDWVHQHDEFTRTTYRAPTVMDPHASEYDRKLMLEGWFDKHMPDLNQDNEFLGNYLIQNNIWWIEYAGIDAFRMDTYAYSDPDFLEKWADAILSEYPQFGIFGETWVHGTPVQAYFHGHTIFDKPFQSRVPGLTDFQLHYALNEALMKPQSWTGGVAKIYYTLAKDFIYTDPNQNVIFLDNHDLSRFYGSVEEDFNKFKMGIAFLMTMRGIPNLYYGTELLQAELSDRHSGTVRTDFPGGWPNDPLNKFTARDRSAKENEAFDYIRKLANWRKSNTAIHTGKLMQFVPQDDVYVYFRYNDEQSVMVVMNNNDRDLKLKTERFNERLDGFTVIKNIITDEKTDEFETIDVPARTVYIFDLIEKD